MSQADLADLIGVRQSTISRWEDGLAEPRREHKLALAKALRSEPSMLFPMLAVN